MLSSIVDQTQLTDCGVFDSFLHLQQADGGVTKNILKSGNGSEKPQKGDQVFGK